MDSKKFLIEPTIYIHGTHDAEQERLAQLNHLTNPPFLRFLEVAETDAVLEVGSGLGLLAGEVARRVPKGRVLGVEFSAGQIARAQADVPNLRFAQGDAHRLPFAGDAFDVVYCRYVLEHVGDPLQVLREMRRVLKPDGRAFAQENDTTLTVFDPDCPATDAVIRQFVTLQSRLGGDGRVGKRLFALFHHAGFHDIELSYQPEIHPANRPTFRVWVENIIGIIDGAADALQAHQLASEAEIGAALSELRHLLTRDDASALFHWNRAVGVK
jgi:SAM-dependent methyltransferase